MYAATLTLVSFMIVQTSSALGQANAGSPAGSNPPVEAKPYHRWAQTPPMGWNSWDCWGTTVTEAQTKANADYMATFLAKHGWEYIVVDIQWYEPNATGHDYRKGAPLEMDEYSRLLPAARKFPSAANGKGFKPLADYVHGKGLKFGIHMMRGIPRQAVEANTAILGTTARAADIADKGSTCPWNPDMYGVDMTKPGAQEYYDSIFQMLAAHGVDFIKVDDLSRPYHQAEVEAVRKAIDKAGRPIVFSTSPGETPLTAGPHVATHANMWRMSDDFWDDWKALRSQFERTRKWAPYTGPGHFPDADMLPMGAVRAFEKDKRKAWTRFTRDEQYTLMSLWSITRSPLMFGGDMPLNDEFTLSMITNDEVLAVNKASANGRQLFAENGLIAWVADAPTAGEKYVAVFNTRDKDKASTSTTTPVPVRLADLSFTGPCRVRDLWKKQDLAVVRDTFEPIVAYHGAGLYRLAPAGE